LTTGRVCTTPQLPPDTGRSSPRTRPGLDKERVVKTRCPCCDEPIDAEWCKGCAGLFHPGCLDQGYCPKCIEYAKANKKDLAYQTRPDRVS